MAGYAQRIMDGSTRSIHDLIPADYDPQLVMTFLREEVYPLRMGQLND